MTHDALLMFAKYPEPGHVKTRLVPPLSQPQAAKLAEWMLLRTADTVRAWVAVSPGVALPYIVVDPVERFWAMAEWLGAPFAAWPQDQGDLGRRMYRAFASAFETGASRVVAIGTDCPALNPTHLAAAFDALASHDAVVGPAADGGYYLLGLRKMVTAPFFGVPWSQPDTLAVTRQRLAAAQVSVADLEALRDVDVPEDLHAEIPNWREIVRGA